MTVEIAGRSAAFDLHRGGREALSRIEGVWGALAGAGAVGTPYQSFAWAEHWLRHRAPKAEPYLLVGQNDLIAPFVLERSRGVRVLRLIGTRDSDYLGLVTLRPIREAWREVAAELARRRADWDLLHLHSTPELEEIIQALREEIGTGGRARVYEICPFIQTDRSWEEFLKARGGDFRRNHRRWARRVEEVGKPTVEVHNAPISDETIRDLEAIQRASWKWSEGDAAFRPGPVRDFLEALLKDPRMELSVWLVRVAGELAGFAIVFSASSRWFYYLSTFRHDHRNVGAFMRAQVVERACAVGCKEVDLLRGPLPYKLEWTDQQRSVHEIVWPSGPIGRLAALGYAIRWRAARSERLHRLRSRLFGVGDRRARSGSKET